MIPNLSGFFVPIIGDPLWGMGTPAKQNLVGLIGRFEYFTTGWANYELTELLFSNASQTGNIRVLHEVKTESCLKLFQTKE